MADRREFNKARRARENRSPAEALLVELSSTRNVKINKKQHDITLKLKHFLSQDGLALVFPESPRPVLSIILSVSTPADQTLACLESVLAYTTRPYELVLLKAPDEDEPDNLLFKKIKNIKSIIRSHDRGSIAALNQGSDQASGEFLFFLSSDTLLTPAWASQLIEALSENPDWGAVGVKRVQTNGTLLEAGNILRPDGTWEGYGRGGNPYKPEYSFVREVDFCLPSCLLVRRDLFQALGGFDPAYTSSFYGAADLGLRLRQHGQRVMVYPPVTVYQQESTPAAVTPATGPAPAEDDRSKFLERWVGPLALQAPPIAAPLWKARDRRPGGRILFIEDRIPAPPQGCGFPRSFTILRFLAELGHVVTVLPTQSPTPWQPYTRTLERLGVETLYGRSGNWRRFFEERKNGYEIVWISRHHNLPVFFRLSRAFLPEAGLIFDSEALFSLRELEKIKLTAAPHRAIREIQFQKRLREEIRLMKQVDLVVTVSETEKGLLKEAGVTNIHVWSHAVSRQTPTRPFRERKDLLFVGGFTARESPNTAAVLYFVNNVFPALQRKLGVRLWIMGSNPPEAVRKLASEQIKVTGFVENLEPFYHQSRVFVVPHQYAGGIPLKLLEALGRGLPAVVSPVIASQLGFSREREVLIAATPEDFILKIERAYTDEKLWTELQEKSLSFIETSCGPDSLKARLQGIIAAVRALKQEPRASAGSA